MNLIKRFIKEEEGQGLVEYALIIGLISLVCVVALGVAGDSLNSLWDAITGQLDTATDAATAGQ